MKHPTFRSKAAAAAAAFVCASRPPLATFACHCTGCQRMSSSAYSLSAMVPSDGFEILSGEPVRGA